jgi:hypothetical protein
VLSVAVSSLHHSKEAWVGSIFWNKTMSVLFHKCILELLSFSARITGIICKKLEAEVLSLVRKEG